MYTESTIPYGRAVWDWLAQPTALFGGVYGLLVSSSAVAALTELGETRAASMDDARWVLFTALASALAHGYAHQIAHRDAQAHPGIRGVVRAVLGEWPLVLAALPTTLLLCGAGLGWWRSQGIEYIAFGINIVLLLCWGLLASRAAGRTWGRAVRIGCADALLGVAVALVSTLLK
ncbi:hypothetical protein PV367_14465 [Streptomyces europaeiscabiei]|uniref:Integral membrane protein n=1 Tax=Streptomyces europaeiscabiei TaxID=146819 RepID=A0AAJ2PNY0_9ACTN|nr:MULTISPECIES: hypothetical protein [Streptomyces]KFF98097.1 hypothetical protein IQ62_26910 [Streptomyces scabiei]MDX3130962.1 hypothetical protein [Streptomyces europaeiscabiei]